MSPMMRARVMTQAKASLPSQAHLQRHLHHPPFELIRLVDEIRLYGIKYVG